MAEETRFEISFAVEIRDIVSGQTFRQAVSVGGRLTRQRPFSEIAALAGSRLNDALRSNPQWAHVLPEVRRG